MTQRQRTRLVDTAQATAGPGFPAAGEPAEAGSVQLIAGADVQDMPLAGRTVAEARTVARAVFGIHPDARALVDGREVDEDHVLDAHQRLEFTRRAGQKGNDGHVIELAGSQARWAWPGAAAVETSIGALLDRVAELGPSPERWELYPPHVRLMVRRPRSGAVGLVIEMPPGPRRVGWVAEDSPAPHGARCTIVDRQLSFPWIVLLVTLVDGELCGLQQVFYRPTPIQSLDDRLHLTNLLNVTRLASHESAICFDNLGRSLRRLPWTERVAVLCDHFWAAAFNHHGNLLGNERPLLPGTGVDGRVVSVAAWEEATRRDPFFALQVAWPPARHRLRATLAEMLERMAPWSRIERAEQLATLMLPED